MIGMRVTQTLIPTLREVPAEADTVSHQLLLRAGMLRKVASGIYTLLPLGYRVVMKIEQIIREEMNRAGGVELLMPIIQPAEIWHETGRWDVYGPEMFRLRDRHGRDFCLGPTHEELITDIIRNEVKSYRQLPLLLYQIQNKYRDEKRPRFGLMRAREFIMKDLYSFDKDEAGLEVSYQKMYEAYCRVFKRCGLDFRVVEADPGAIGGGETHEFMVLADTGESKVVFCTSCDYAANVEKAPCDPQIIPSEENPRPLEMVATPDMRTVKEVADYLGVPSHQLIKTMFYKVDGEYVAVLVRGDRVVNETKVKNFLGATSVEIASEDEVMEAFGVPLGYAGPVGLQEKDKIKVIGDHEVRYLVNAVTGANKEGYHYRNVNTGRDYQVDAWADLRVAGAGDLCPRCKAPFQAKRGIEVGQIFKLGVKYSKALGATVLNENGKEVPIVMGCYGIGVTRTMAAAVEQNHDEDGIIWPPSIAPYEVVVIPVSHRDMLQVRMAEEVYQSLAAAGIDVIYDDRPERPGVKFKDADLIGYPVRIVIGSRAVEDGLVEIKWRASKEILYKSKEELVPYLRSSLERSKNNCI
ncbi:MAG: Proline--tRNA ligase [Thermoanaerobacterales bacterium 50_218]|nr:MAG: Proline--tRNA ligase [Thermoanaerobacterales bacterium 50_218]